MTPQQRLDNLRQYPRANPWRRAIEHLIGLSTLGAGQAAIDPFRKRYLALLRTPTGPEHDHVFSASANTLEEVAGVVSDHVFEQTREENDTRALVIDLDTGTSVGWVEDRAVVFADFKKTVFVVHREEDDCRPFLGLFSTPEKARAAIAADIELCDGSFTPSDYSVLETTID